ncbi:MAG: hypothetical protein CEE38_01680 [Planctomycetes bacterium B3_Pla]|nr:MAG: hypothetical protein CEE38_01680 [Planctomycetes bacterium B3_Pla]
MWKVKEIGGNQGKLLPASNVEYRLKCPYNRAVKIIQRIRNGWPATGQADWPLARFLLTCLPAEGQTVGKGEHFTFRVGAGSPG